MADDNKKLVKRAIAGDKNAFGELYKIFLNKIYRFVYFLVRDEFLAEDITQNTFLKAWNSLPNFSVGRGTFQSFLYTIARNLVIDNQRRKKEISLGTEFGEAVESGENPEAEVWKNESMQRVRLALSNLEELDRQIIILRFFEDLKFDEISQIVGKEPGALRVKVHRLLEIMRKDLESNK